MEIFLSIFSVFALLLGTLIICVFVAFAFILLRKEVKCNDAKATHSQTDCEKDEQGHEKPPC